MLYISLSICYYFRTLFKVFPGSYARVCFSSQSTCPWTVYIYCCSLVSATLLGVGCQGGCSSCKFYTHLLERLAPAHYCLFLQGVYQHLGICFLWILSRVWYGHSLKDSALFLRVLLIFDVSKTLRGAARSWVSSQFLISPDFFEGVPKWSGILCRIFPW